MASRLLRLTAVILSVALSSCAAPNRARELSLTEKVEKDQALSGVLVRKLESSLKLKDDSEIAGYLKKITENLGGAELGVMQIGMIDDRDAPAKWENFGAPGKLFISLSLLRNTQFENETAAILAYELSLLANRYALERLEKLSPKSPNEIELRGSKGVFGFSDQEREDAVKSAVDRLYRAGYDPRGLVAIWKRLQASPSRSPISGATIQLLLEKTRDALAVHAPLRNPVVRSQAYFKIQKRIQKL